MGLRSPWPHRWAWLLACATFPLLWVGGLVTTTGAGMAFKDWLTSDGHFMLFYPWLSSQGDKFVEHGHRLLGAIVGVLAIALVVATFKHEPRSWVRKYSWLILVGVILQGTLGGMRVVFDERVLALVHGCTGPAFFSMCVGMVIVTSQWWLNVDVEKITPGNKKFLRLAIFTTLLSYSQIIAGALVRHSPHLTGDSTAVIFQAAVYFHVLLALAITVHVLLLVLLASRNKIERLRSVMLGGVVSLQVLLGASAWIVKYGFPQWAARIVGDSQHVNTANNFHQAGIVTTHMAIGSLIFVMALTISLRTARRLRIGMPVLSAARHVRIGAAL